MPDARTYRRIMRASALYDLIVTLPFVTPWSFGLLAAGMLDAQTRFGLPGMISVPDVTTVLLANLMGSVVVVWSLARLRLDLPILGRFDSLARLLFAIWQGAALANGMSWIIMPLLTVEIGFSVAQALPIRLSRNDEQWGLAR